MFFVTFFVVWRLDGRETSEGGEGGGRVVPGPFISPGTRLYIAYIVLHCYRLFHIAYIVLHCSSFFYIAYNVLHCCRFFCTAIIAFSAYIVASYTEIHPLCMIYL